MAVKVVLMASAALAGMWSVQVSAATISNSWR